MICITNLIHLTNNLWTKEGNKEGKRGKEEGKKKGERKTEEKKEGERKNDNFLQREFLSFLAQRACKQLIK